MLQTVLQWIETNPSKDSCVVPIEIRVESDTGISEVVNGPGGLVGTPLEPPGPVSFYLWHTDPLYRAGTYTYRKQILRDTLVELATKVETTCKGHRWSRKKILEQLAAQQTSAASPPQDTHELDEALCFIFGFQKIILDDIHKRVLQFPQDLREWTSENPVWTTGLGSRCIYHLPGESSLSHGLGSWLLLRETEGRSIRWPSVDGKADEVKRKCEELGISPRGVEKPKKDDWCLTLGRSHAIANLLRNFS